MEAEGCGVTGVRMEVEGCGVRWCEHGGCGVSRVTAVGGENERPIEERMN